jgi:hypothetical protein
MSVGSHGTFRGGRGQHAGTDQSRNLGDPAGWREPTLWRKT